ncbi:peptide MFS transporter [Streptomyces regalis]|uniref:Peptide permease n=1 Tax=Streptomyces regalis TaxID=68262 RepID=A0A101JJZ7_9ACTN|nr:peptide MFS transporter [Streptomyces regalis]KUL28275.1 peptide permease [Streptomyces regalis]
MEPGSGPPHRSDQAFFGQPRGLLTLCGLEVWERFSFLGMQAILVLYFADTVTHGGMGMSAGTAASVSAAYGTLVHLVSVVGGRLADRILGSYRAVLWGGILIACGHYAMAVPTAGMTWVGLGLISAGTGLLKPDVATMVGKLYRTDDNRRDAGFALSYMAINIGAFAGPLFTGWLGDHRGWHWGFSAAAIGMTLGLVQYVAGRRHLAGRKHAAEVTPPPDSPTLECARAGEPPPHQAIRVVAAGPVVAGLVATAVIAVRLAAADRLTVDRFVDLLTLVSVIATIAYFAVMFTSPRVTPEERGRLRPYIVLLLASTVFNFVLFQAYSTMMLASTNTERSILGFHFPAGWYASALGAFEVALAPAVAALWVRTRRRQPHASNKIAIGGVLGGLSFLLMVLPTLGQSAEGHLMSVLYDDVSQPAYFGVNGAIAVAAGLAVTAAAPWLRRTMHPVH